ncbi:rhomboid-like protein [Kitasatospora mediocidica]|uniref:rhomboid-like protein n=1 Tax=Kitasatospora mediocidica TaxID=58352 RepID=UPI00068BF8E9|nr:rhomboid-like protein [Kitasatospora mediocidica]
MAYSRQGTARLDLAAPYAGLRFGLRAGPLHWVLDRVPTPRRNPFALTYLLVLAGTTVFAQFADPGLVHQLQNMSSTDGHNLVHTPLRSLLMSGLWVAGPVWMPYLWAFAFTVAPLERRVGPLRALGVFAAGHVVGTLLSQLVVAVAVATGRMAPSELDVLDIGVSYGVLASLGALAGLLSVRGRYLALAGAFALVVHQIANEQDLVTAIGHPTALLVGMALWGPLRRPPGNGQWRRRGRRLGKQALPQPQPHAVLDNA